MQLFNRKRKFLLHSFVKHDFKASINVLFVALPLCLGISLASGAPVYSGLIAGVVGGILVGAISGSQLSVSGPAAGLTAICVGVIAEVNSLQLFFLTVSVAGLLQVLLGLFRLGGFTSFIPSAVIKGMLAAIGLLLIIKQLPLLIGYDQPDFWTNELVNVFKLNNVFSHIDNMYHHISAGAIVIAAVAFVLMVVWKKKFAQQLSFIPASFIMVITGVALAYLFRSIPFLQLKPSQYVNIPANLLSQINLQDVTMITSNVAIWKNAVIICFVATLETLLSIEAIDKIDSHNRITPQNRELIAQGSGNIVTGLLGGIPITAVIVRSAANASAGAKTKASSILHGVWLLLLVLFAIPLVNLVPFSVLAVILIGTGYNLAKPSMIKAVYRQGREQFVPFIVTIAAILLTDLLVGVLIGFAYSIYFIIKHTYRAGYILKTKNEGHIKHYKIELALNVSFLNKKKIASMLDELPPYSIVEINGSNSVYIDHDILEIIKDYKPKAHARHIELKTKAIPDVETIEMH